MDDFNVVDTCNEVISVEFLAILYLVTFICLAFCTLYLVYAIHIRFKGSFKNEKRKLLLVLCLFSISYSYRWILDLTQMSIELSDMSYSSDATLCFFLYFIGEILPLSALFYFHFLNNKAYE